MHDENIDRSKLSKQKKTTSASIQFFLNVNFIQLSKYLTFFQTKFNKNLASKVERLRTYLMTASNKLIIKLGSWNRMKKIMTSQMLRGYKQ